MCGVGAMFGADWDRSRLEAMLTSQRHRGPDAQGIYLSPGGRAGLAHNRLSIIDLTDAGRQPLSDAQGRYWIVFNGEIYNYIELRAELEVKGLEADSREEGLLVQIRQVADEIAELRALVDSEGWTFPPATRNGPPRMHPAIAEIRQGRSLLGRLLAQISLEESTVNPVKRKAANTRWRAHQMQQARQAEGGR